MEGRIAELIALSVIVLSTWQGASRGLVLKIYSLVRIILLLAATILLVPLLLPLFPSDLQAREGIALLAALAIAAITLHILARVLKIIDHIPVVNTVNKLGGALLGLAIGLLLVWTALLVIGTLQELAWCRQASSYISQSPILLQFQALNPLSKILEHFEFPNIIPMAPAADAGLA